MTTKGARGTRGDDSSYPRHQTLDAPVPIIPRGRLCESVVRLQIRKLRLSAALGSPRRTALRAGLASTKAPEESRHGVFACATAQGQCGMQREKHATGLLRQCRELSLRPTPRTWVLLRQRPRRPSPFEMD